MSTESEPDDRSEGAVLRAIARAIELQQRGRLDDAEAIYERLLARHDRDATILINGGALALARGDVATSVARLDRAVALVPANAVAHANLGFALIHADRFADALAALDRAVALKPDFAQAHNSRGMALVRMKRRDEARRAFEQALALRPKHAEASLNLGELANQEGDTKAARSAYRRVLEWEPDRVVARTGVAFADALDGELEHAIELLDGVVEDHPKFAPAWQTLGAVCNWAWRHDAAESAYREALAIEPDVSAARFGLAASLLARGRYDEGLAEFDASRAGFAPAAPVVRALAPWRGEPMHGTLVLYAEQGLGDVVQFARFVPALRERVHRIVVWLEGYWTPLAPLLASLEGVDAIVTDAQRLADERPQMRASFLSLARFARATPASLWTGAYLSAPAERIDAWRARVDATARVRVGLAWSVHARDDHGYVTRHKSIPPQELLPLLEIGGVAFHSLQPGPAGDPSVFGAAAARIADTGASIRDFGDTAALIEGLDMVIAADTAVAHVAGALGKPVWLLERRHGCWRWRLSPDTSPWYPALRIFRQAKFNRWREPVEQIAAALAALAT